jgi:hypothetical protein
VLNPRRKTQIQNRQVQSGSLPQAQIVDDTGRLDRDFSSVLIIPPL